jgi:hypothetical protein
MPDGAPSEFAEELRGSKQLPAADPLRRFTRLGIPLVDNVIVTRDPGRWHSMATRGTLPRAS